MSRTKIPVRFADSTTTANIEIDPSKLRDIQILENEVFATIDEIRIAMSRKNYNELFEAENKK
jgi:hypothetical protein